MPPRIINPITEKLKKIIALGEKSKETICDECNLTHPTFANIFSASRPTISPVTILALKHAGYITDLEIEIYNKWKDENIESIRRIRLQVKKYKAARKKYKKRSPNPRYFNPIAKKVHSIIESGLMKRERMCRALDCKYNTFMNIFDNRPISYTMLYKLKYAGVISEKEEREYEEWLNARGGRRRYWKKYKLRGGRDDGGNEEGSENTVSEHAEQDGPLDQSPEKEI